MQDLLEQAQIEPTPTEEIVTSEPTDDELNVLVGFTLNNVLDDAIVQMFGTTHAELNAIRQTDRYKELFNTALVDFHESEVHLAKNWDNIEKVAASNVLLALNAAPADGDFALRAVAIAKRAKIEAKKAQIAEKSTQINNATINNSTIILNLTPNLAAALSNNATNNKAIPLKQTNMLTATQLRQQLNIDYEAETSQILDVDNLSLI